MSRCASCDTEAGDIARFCPSCGASIVRGPQEDEYAGRIIAGKFRVEGLIGEGGMGKVFKATQLSLDKTVVLKVLRRSLLSDARTVARFQREAKAASRLNHPNSISVIDFGQGEDGSMYIAMEYVNGQDLHQLLAAEGPLPEHRIVRIASQVLSALADAHAAGVIHRDLKPENIMVEQRRGQPDFVKVLDFGIAKIQESDGSESQALTRAGFVCGTPEYMSPEQARGVALDARSDLYAVGVICYQCATNTLPFEAESAVGLATMHLTTPPEAPRTRRPDAMISDAMEQLILRAMAKDPNDRPQSAEEFRRELAGIGQSSQATRVQAMPPMPARRPASARRNNRAPALSGEATQLARTPGWRGATTGEEVTATPVATNPGGPLPSASRGRLVMIAAAAGAIALLGSGFAAYRLFVASPESRGANGVGAGADAADRHERRGDDIDLARDNGDPHAGPARRDPVRARELLQQGNQAVAAGNHRAALELYSQSFDAFRDPAVAKRIALTCLALGEGATADKWLRYYLDANPGAPDAAGIERYLRSRPDPR